MYEILIGSLVFVAITALGGATLAGLRARHARVRARLSDLQPKRSASRGEHGRPPLVGLVGRIGRAVSPAGSPSASLGEQLTRAGYFGKTAPTIYLGVKVVLLVLGLTVAGLALLYTHLSPQNKILVAVVLAGGLFFAPNMFLELKRRRRCQQIREHLADAIDLLEICVCSGMGLDQAWNLIGDEIRDVSPTLADEMALTNFEMHLGASRVGAMRSMAARTGADEIASFASLLVQSERFGTSMADVLRNFATSMREERSFRAQETAEKAAVKLLFPMILFIFPALLVVLAGPMAIRMLDVMGRT